MRLFFSVGEPSGDEHAAHLIQELRRRHPALECDGFGGPEMQQQGCILLHELTQDAVMGILKVIPMIAHFRRLVKRAEQHLEATRPDAVVLVDFPGFNWWIARAAHRLGIPVYYYLPPQLWAWASWRIRRVRKWIDHVICALPFEYDWYRQRGVSCTWVGHPFFDEVADTPLNLELVDQLRGSTDSRRLFALLPGSRGQEVERNWPVMLQAAARASEQAADVRWVVGCFLPEHQARCEQLRQEIAPQLQLEYQTGQASEVIEAADACLMVSGSVSLELLARRTPGIVLYRTGRLTRWAARWALSCRFITLTNLIADREVMPEFLSAGDPGPDVSRISDLLTKWGVDPTALADRRQAMSQLADSAATTGATRRTAELLLDRTIGPSRSDAQRDGDKAA